MLRQVWLWLRNPENQGTVSFLGGGFAIIISGLWQLYIWTSAPPPEESATGTSANAGLTQSFTATAPGGGVAVVQTGAGHIAITTGISDEKLVQLAGELGVARGALKSFFAVLQHEQVPPENLDSALREIAKRYKDLQAKLETFAPSESAAAALRQDVREALEAGDFSRAETLLNEASDRDIAAAREIMAKAKQRLLSAASTRAVAGDLKYTQMAYTEAAEYYRQAADLVAVDEPLAAAAYLGQQGAALLDGGRHQQAREPLERALSIRQHGLPPEDPQIAHSLDDLASWHRAQGGYTSEHRG